MEELDVKSEPIQPIWYNSDETQSLSGGKRWRNGVRSSIWRPPTDVFENEQEVIVRVEIAGMREDDFSISLTGDRLTVRGNRPDIQEKRAYHQMEIFFGEFNVEVNLPAPVLADKVIAEYQAGFLRLVFPKDKPKKIQVSE
jgi:HSP20 family protein